MKTITFLGSDIDTEYTGWDGDTAFTISAGDDIEVSDEKAEQVAADFPHLFLVDGKKPPKPKHDAPAADPAATNDAEPDAAAELAALTVPELTARAEQLGLEVGKKPLKADLVAAIVEKLNETNDDDETTEGGAE